MNNLVDIGLYLSYALVVLCAIAAIGIPLVQSFGDPGTLVKSGIGVGVLIVVFLLGYVLADGSSPGTTESTSKWVGAGIITMYVLFFGAIIGIVATEISKIVR